MRGEELRFLKIHNSPTLSTKEDLKYAGKSPKIGVCVKGMDFLDGDISPRRLVEWIGNIHLSSMSRLHNDQLV